MKAAIVIPCYNEADRLDAPELVRLCATPGNAVIFVDDGSTDGTADALTAIVSQSGGSATVMNVPSNVGKGEAVRIGLVEALGSGVPVVGFADADLATPVDEIVRLSTLAHRQSADVVLGARVKLAGRAVQRNAGRHYIGRLIATYLVLRTGLPVYDTQCGAKFFRASKELKKALATPFGTRWLFDVELLRRLHEAHSQSGIPLSFREEPLEAWTDVAETHMKGGEVLQVIRDIASLEVQLRAQDRMNQVPIAHFPSVRVDSAPHGRATA